MLIMRIIFIFAITYINCGCYGNRGCYCNRNSQNVAPVGYLCKTFLIAKTMIEERNHNIIDCQRCFL